MSLAIFFTSYVLDMFRPLINPSSGACDYSVELPHWLYSSWFDVCWEFRCGWVGVVSVLQASANVVIQQNSHKLLMMDILMSETCWAHKKWNKIASDIKLVFYSSTITMMHGPINIRFPIDFLMVLKYQISWKSVQCKHSCFMRMRDRHDKANSRFSQSWEHA